MDQWTTPTIRHGNSRLRRMMLRKHNAESNAFAVGAARSKFVAESSRIEGQQRGIARTQAFAQATASEYVSIDRPDGSKVYLISEYGTSRKRISSGSIPDSMVSRTDTTDYVFRRAAVRQSYYKGMEKRAKAKPGYKPGRSYIKAMGLPLAPLPK